MGLGVGASYLQPACPHPTHSRTLAHSQVFVANPNKPQSIVDILTNNRDKLLKYLEEFHTDKGGCGDREGSGMEAACPLRAGGWAETGEGLVYEGGTEGTAGGVFSCKLSGLGRLAETYMRPGPYILRLLVKGLRVSGYILLLQHATRVLCVLR